MRRKVTGEPSLQSLALPAITALPQSFTPLLTTAFRWAAGAGAPGWSSKGSTTSMAEGLQCAPTPSPPSCLRYDALFFSCGGQERLGGDRTETTNPNWPKGHSIPYGIMEGGGEKTATAQGLAGHQSLQRAVVLCIAYLVNIHNSPFFFYLSK